MQAVSRGGEEGGGEGGRGGGGGGGEAEMGGCLSLTDSSNQKQHSALASARTCAHSLRGGLTRTIHSFTLHQHTLSI